MAHDHIEAFRIAQRDARETHLGDRAYMYLKVVAVNPDRQRQGAGRVLVEWGCAEADRRGVAAYLEASVVGKGLYAKCGFSEVGLLDWDARRLLPGYCMDMDEGCCGEGTSVHFDLGGQLRCVSPLECVNASPVVMQNLVCSDCAS